MEGLQEKGNLIDNMMKHFENIKNIWIANYISETTRQIPRDK